MPMTDADLLRLLNCLIDGEGWWVDVEEGRVVAYHEGARFLRFRADTIRDALEGLAYLCAYDWWATVCDDEEDGDD